MHLGTEAITSTLVGVTTGLASLIVQAAPVTMHPLTVPTVSAAVGGIVSFAVLRTTVVVVERDLKEVRTDVKDISTRLARIEGAAGIKHDGSAL